MIHRHGLREEAAAREVEAALIDAYPGLSNIQGGYESDRGVMHVEEVAALYRAENAEFRHRVMLVNVGKRSIEEGLLDASRYAWLANRENAKRVEYVLLVLRGIIKGAFIAGEWLDATPEHFPGFPLTNPRRIGFVGREAPSDIVKLYRGKRVAWGRYAFRYEPAPSAP